VIEPLARPVPLRQSGYDALIDLVITGELLPGQRLVETDRARQLGVSRQPIREALHRMEAERWVDLWPSQGAFVHVPTEPEVDELLDARALLEAETARLAARPPPAPTPAATPNGPGTPTAAPDLRCFRFTPAHPGTGR
jgi:DNA-binding GntR family transcriptional regulator